MKPPRQPHTTRRPVGRRTKTKKRPLSSATGTGTTASQSQSISTTTTTTRMSAKPLSASTMALPLPLPRPPHSTTPAAAASATPTTTTTTTTPARLPSIVVPAFVRSSSGSRITDRHKIPGRTTTASFASSSALFAGATTSNHNNSNNNKNNSNNSIADSIVGIFRRTVALVLEQQQRQDQKHELETTATVRRKRNVAPKLVTPYLYAIPDQLHPYYQPLPRFVQLLNWCFSTCVAILSSSLWRHRHLRSSTTTIWSTVRSGLLLVCKSVTLTWAVQCCVQDLFCPSKFQPSRIVVPTLLRQYWLPSPLSRYQTLTLPPTPPGGTQSTAIDEEESSTSATAAAAMSLGVHYLHYVNKKHSVPNTNNQNKTTTTTASSSASSSTSVAVTSYNFEAMYCQHGFGASSLSWLPILVPLAQQLQVRTTLGHDAVGFGFTERPPAVPPSTKYNTTTTTDNWYTSKQSSRIAQQLLRQNTETIFRRRERSPTTTATTTRVTATTTSRGPQEAAGSLSSSTAAAAPASPPAVVLVGHSMGSLSILRLALGLPRDVPKLIILSSPALGLLHRRRPRRSSFTAATKTPTTKEARRSTPAVSVSSSTWLRRRRTDLQAVTQTRTHQWSRRVVRPIVTYILRRAVGTNNSWRQGLQLAYGRRRLRWDEEEEEDGGDTTTTTNNTTRESGAATVTDSDVLRYAWPAIGDGWEQGVLNFATAQQLPQEDALDDDALLLRRVLDLPQTQVLILLGSDDTIVPSQHVYNFVHKVLHEKNDNNNKKKNNDDDNDEHRNDSTIPIVEMDGLGHCAFEEDPEEFCSKVGELVNEHWKPFR